jgi:hypothetical protein|tara:strand:- start:119965 stop:120129 length:165 start_codon:yes stop_codon:yes gene_type:complete
MQAGNSSFRPAEILSDVNEEPADEHDAPCFSFTTTKSTKIHKNEKGILVAILLR